MRESGMTEGTPGIEIIGPSGSVKITHGVIVAKRHIHMTPMDAIQFGVYDKQMISVDIDGTRGARLNNVLIRVSQDYALEMHIDVEEANALGVETGDNAFMVLPRLQVQ